MIIRKVAVGDKAESYVENNLTEGINVISSDDNNKGKTIILQSMMYAIGNEPSFPVSFEYRNYYYYIEFEVSGRLFCLCRYNDSFVLRYETTLMIFDNVAELKRHWTKYIFELPVIIKS